MTHQARFTTLMTLSPQWLIIDAAACAEPVWFAQGGGCNTWSLFSSKEHALADTGPWLIEVTNNEDLIALCLKKDVFGHACLWFNSTLPVKRIVQLLQQRLYATTPDGEQTRFRFYDPRVLHFYLHDMQVERRLDFLAPFSALFYAELNPYQFASHWLGWRINENETIATRHEIEAI